MINEIFKFKLIFFLIFLGSAGGIATYMWINRIYRSNLWDNTKTKILAGLLYK